jgi:hypothetical protein
MNPLVRSCIAAMLASSLATFPLMGAGEKPLGVVIQADHARVDTAEASKGATLYAGDTFDTDAGGALRLSIGSGQIYLPASSAATLSSNSNLAHVTLTRGSLTMASSASGQLEVETPAGVLRGADGQAVTGQATIASPKEVLVSAVKGNLILDNDGELHTIPEGKAYRIMIDQDPSPTPVQDNYPQDFHRAKNRKRLAFFLILTGGLALISYGAWSELSESPSKPK